MAKVAKQTTPLNDFNSDKLVYSAKYLALGTFTKHLSSMLLVLLILTMCFYRPVLSALLLFLNITYMVIFIPKLFYYLLGCIYNFLRAKPDLTTLRDDELPIYTILLPMYKEADTLQYLMDAIAKFDYPLTKLDVKIILETNDEITPAVVQHLHMPFPHEVITVPAGVIQTKPRACNYALASAKGEFLVIYDAEDRPEPDQLKKAVYQFRHSKEQVACLQASLNYYNRDDNWLTKMFALEYSVWFDFLLPGLSVSNSLIPLGGTSNHFRTKLLRDIGGWDAYNVTEDADIGVRLGRADYLVKSLDSHTWEEAPNALRAWLKQRTRWIKGYMQTYLIHSGRSDKLIRELGLRNFLNFQLFLGGPVIVFILSPLVLSITNLLYWQNGSLLPLNNLGFTLGIFNSWASFIIIALMNFVVIIKYHWKHMWFSMISMPFYYVLHMIAGFLALQEFIHAPFKWNKTCHGTSYALQANRLLSIVEKQKAQAVQKKVKSTTTKIVAAKVTAANNSKSTVAINKK